MTELDPAALTDRVVTDVWATFTSGTNLGVLVDSPPGAGKSTLVARTAIRLAKANEPVMVVAQTNEQVDDLIDRMARQAPNIGIGRLSATDYVPNARVGHANVRVRRQVGDMTDVDIVVATAAKWSHVRDVRWPWAIVDEVYQMRADALLRVATRFDSALFVGDPGQLDPFSIVESERWVGLAWDPMQSAAAVLLRNNEDLPKRTLPLSWRLSASAAPPVAGAFYPFTGFQAATTEDQRGLTFQTKGFGGPVDESLELAARTGWALHELPARHTVRTDAEAVTAIADLAERTLQRGAVARSEREPGGVAVTEHRIAIGAAHRNQVAAIRIELDRRGLRDVKVDTANRLQGREFDIVLVLHPLSGRRDATSFHLESGRLCVLTSRHRHACIVVSRAGTQSLLDAHPPSEPMYIDVPAKFPDGWEANHAMLEHLMRHRVSAA